VADIVRIDPSGRYNCFSAVVETGYRMQTWEPTSESEHCPVQVLLSTSGRLDDKCYYCN